MRSRTIWGMVAALALGGCVLRIDVPSDDDASVGGGDEDGGGGGDSDGGAAGDPDAAPPPGVEHIQLANGFSVTVWRDFSPDHVYSATDFTDGASVVDNAPRKLFVLRSPFPEGLAVVAGRDVLELPANGAFATHDFGNHAPDTAGQPDELRDALCVGNVGGPAPLALTSSSTQGGDGVFGVSASWEITQLRNDNNTRAICFDEAGKFDNTGVATAYFGTQANFSRFDLVTPVEIALGDTNGCTLLADSALIIRRIAVGTEVPVRINTVDHVETQLENTGLYILADGALPENGLSWVIRDRVELALMDGDGALTPIAHTLDSTFTWVGVAVPEPGHALGGVLGSSFYVLETNRALNVDRILRVSSP